MKISGALWKQFYSDEKYWEGYYHDDTCIIINGSPNDDYEDLADDDELIIESGYVYLHNSDGHNRHDMPLEKFFKKWKKSLDEIAVVVMVSKGSLEEVKKQIKNIQGVRGLVS